MATVEKFYPTVVLSDRSHDARRQREKFDSCTDLSSYSSIIVFYRSREGSLFLSLSLSRNETNLPAILVSQPIPREAAKVLPRESLGNETGSCRGKLGGASWGQLDPVGEYSLGPY